MMYGSYMHGGANYSPQKAERLKPPASDHVQSIALLRTELSYADRSHVSGRRNPSRYNHEAPSFARIDYDLLRAADRAAAAVRRLAHIVGALYDASYTVPWVHVSRTHWGLGSIPPLLDEIVHKIWPGYGEI